jgi:16S rRNA (uracil1498-N3)-methyltransferase
MSQLQRLVITFDQLEADRIILSASQQHYLRRVLRLQKGDRFIAVDGQGRWLLSELASSSDQATVLDELDGTTELPIALTLVIAMPKQGMDDIVRCCTELGVTTIQPVTSDRTILNPSRQKIERWQRIAEEAAEQSERRWVPQVLSPCSLASLLTQHPYPLSNDIDPKENRSLSERYLCVARHDAPHLLRVLAQQNLIRPADVHEIIVAIGPEGGWTPAEIDMAIARGFRAVSLGQRILRAVTAPTVALSLVASSLEGEKSPPS